MVSALALEGKVSGLTKKSLNHFWSIERDLASDDGEINRQMDGKRVR
jgi:hypothetical protein